MSSSTTIVVCGGVAGVIRAATSPPFSTHFPLFLALLSIPTFQIYPLSAETS
jgi:hypothetical protein